MSKKKFSIFDLGTNLKVSGKWNYYIMVPAVILLVAIIAFSIYAAVNHTATQGMNLGLDFTGGTSITVTVGEELTDEQYNALSQAYVEIIEAKGFATQNAQKTGSGTDTAIYIKYSNPTLDDQLSELNTSIVNEIVNKSSDMGYAISAEDNVSWQSISAGSANKLLRQAIIAIVITWVLVLIYVIIRFELWSGIAAVIALMIDVIVMTAMTIIFHVPVNSTFVAALITIVAYSINNTIVVFDRVREHVKSKGTQINSRNIGFEVDTAVQETTSRSIATTITTMITVLLLCILGVDSVREFCLPVIFGLISGVFTSLFIAPSLYVAMRMAWFKRHEVKSGYVGAVSQKEEAVDDGGETLEGSAPVSKPAAPKTNANKNKKQQNANLVYKYKKKKK